jgi:hypothetical protein
MKTLIAILASTLLVGGAWAQSARPPAAVVATGEAAKGAASSQAKVEMHINDLHARLKISAPEEAQWNAVASAMRQSASDLDAAIDKRQSMGDKASAIDDLNAYAAIAQSHADGVKKLVDVFAPLYAAMSDPQKKLADEVFMPHSHAGQRARTAPN